VRSFVLATAALAASALLLAQGNGNGNGKGKANGRGNHVIGQSNESGTGGSGITPLNYNGGPVMLGQTHIYFIYYGDWSVDSNAKAILSDFANGLSGSGYYNILTQYSSGGSNISNSVVLSGTYTSSYVAAQPTNLNDGDIQGIVQSAIKGGTPVDPNGVYFVLTAPGVGESSGFLSSYCGWHTAATINGTWVKYAFVGDAGNNSGCSVQFGSSPNGDPPVDAMISVIAHELSESVTDPLLNAWYDSAGNEIGDKCAWNFGTEFTAPNGSTANITLGGFNFLIQQEFSNASDSCVMTYGGATPDFSLSVSPGSQSALSGATTGNYTVTVNSTGGFSSPVNLSLAGNPASSTPSAFSANPASTTSTFNINTGTATAGTYPLTITGTGGGLTHTAQASLVIPQPDFTISIAPGSQTVLPGGMTSTAYVINVTPVNGFTGTPTYTINNPTGTTVTPSDATHFMLTAGSSMSAGTYSFSVVGKSGTLSHSANASLTVNPAGSFTVTISPSSQSVTRRNSVKYTITVTGSGGFNSKVNLTVSNMPSRVSPSLSPSSITGSGTSTLTLSTSHNTPTGSATFTVTGTSGSLTSSTTASITVQ